MLSIAAIDHITFKAKVESHNTSTMISRIPSEVLLHICDYLGMDSIAHLAATSRCFRQVISEYDMFSSSRIDGKNVKVNDDTLIHGVLSYIASNSLYVDLSNSDITHVGVYHIVTKYSLVQCIRIAESRVNETELARRLVIYCRKHPPMRKLIIELGLPRKPLKDDFVKTLKKAYPALTLKRWFCPSHPLDINKFHKASVNDPDDMLCHECFEITPRGRCYNCCMTTCPRCIRNMRCIGCNSNQHNSITRYYASRNARTRHE